MTTFENLRMDSNAGALQALDPAELAGVDGGIGPLGCAGVLLGAGIILGITIYAGYRAYQNAKDHGLI
jgi:lactobin A/cerein 7B family class IIb bacteriocin